MPQLAQPTGITRVKWLALGLVAALGAAVAAGACNDPGTPTPPSLSSASTVKGSASAAPRAAGPKSTSEQLVNRVLALGLDDEQLAKFFHLSEGSEFVPLCALKLYAAERKQTLNEYFESYNLIADPPHHKTNPFGLAIGLTVSGDPSRMVGFNCAACHVGRVQANGEAYIAVGAPASFNIRQFYDDLIPWIGDVLLPDRKRVAKVAGCMLLGSHGEVTASSSADSDLHTVSDELHQRLESGPELSDQGSELYGHLDAAGDKGSAKDARARAEEAIAGSSPRFKELPKAKRLDLLQKLVLAYEKQKGLLLARKDALRIIRQVGEYPLTKPGPGRVDAFMTALNIMKPELKLDMNSPVAFPPLWDVAGLKWRHFDDNTNATMQRNMGQAIGVGALFTSDPKHPDHVLGTTLKVDEIESLEAILEKITPPPSPFPRNDNALLERGAALYEGNCAKCHAGTPDSKLPEAPEGNIAGTDEQRLKNFARLAAGEPVIAMLSHLLTSVEKASRPKHLDKDAQWRTTGRYGYRMLHGVWATAPYLHNNSVPSLADLLTRPEQRPKKFVIDYSKYDPERVGFATLPQATNTAPELDTAENGNGNQGHGYGVELSAADKHALLYFLRQL